MENKIKNLDEMAMCVKAMKAFKTMRIVTTNGTFDILHPAHLRMLEKAKSFGDILIVLINSDRSVKKLKGVKRPIFNQDERAFMLSCLQAVDYVLVFEEDTPLGVLEVLKPDIHVKGGSFILERIKAEKELLESWGGRFVSLPLEKEISSTAVIYRIVDEYGNPDDVA